MPALSDIVRTQITAAIARATGTGFDPRTVTEIGGGCISRALRLADHSHSYFVKINDSGLARMFEAERDGLEALDRPGAPRIPRPVVDGAAEGIAFLVLEDIPMSRLHGQAWRRLGEQLAALHRHTAPRFGWHQDNLIGATPQRNDWTGDWLSFWRDRRLGFQLALARDNGLDRAVLQRAHGLLERLDRALNGHAPQASLVHGDLWGGNAAADSQGNPVLFDPAVYYGDRETDLAMSELFGGFDPRFYEAYQSVWPLEPGYPRRRTLYNLYHVLNHFNLFGAAYAPRAAAMIDELLAATG